MNDDDVLPRCMKQIPKRISPGVFDVQLEEYPETTYGAFKSKAKANERLHTDDKTAEDEFWTQATKERVYASDNPISLFEDAIIWNLDKFTKDESTIHSKPSHHTLKVSAFSIRISSIHTSLFFYLGKFRIMNSKNNFLMPSINFSSYFSR